MCPNKIIFPIPYFYRGLCKCDSELQKGATLDAGKVLEAVKHYWYLVFWQPDPLWNCEFLFWMFHSTVIYFHSAHTKPSPLALLPHLLHLLMLTPWWGIKISGHAPSIFCDGQMLTCLVILFIALKIINICVQNSLILNPQRQEWSFPWSYSCHSVSPLFSKETWQHLLFFPVFFMATSHVPYLFCHSSLQWLIAYTYFSNKSISLYLCHCAHMSCP